MAASQVPTKGREERDALGCGYLNVIAKTLTFSPSIVFYAVEQGAEKTFQTPFHNTVRHCEAGLERAEAISSSTPHFHPANSIQPIRHPELVEGLLSQFLSRLIGGGLFLFSGLVIFFIGLQACFAGWLGPKETKAQGLDPMSDKFVKA